MIFQFDVLKKIGGDIGTSNGKTIIESIVYSLIDPTFLSNISWTGRGKPNETKIAMKQFTNITDLIIYTTQKADSSCTREKILKMLKYKVIKYALQRLSNGLNKSTEYVYIYILLFFFSFFHSNKLNLMKLIFQFLFQAVNALQRAQIPRNQMEMIPNQKSQ